MDKSRVLDRSFYGRDSCLVARELLGKKLVKLEGDKILSGFIVETEAYYGKNDSGSHASRGKTDRNSIMWETPGLIYVYLCYGNHFLFNVVTEEEGVPGAVLIRGLEPDRGIELMKKRRSVEEIGNLTDGPGKLAEALSIDKGYKGLDLTLGDYLFIEEGRPVEEKVVGRSARIGLSAGAEEEFRFYLKSNPFVSG